MLSLMPKNELEIHLKNFLEYTAERFIEEMAENELILNDRFDKDNIEFMLGEFIKSIEIENDINIGRMLGVERESGTLLINSAYFRDWGKITDTKNQDYSAQHFRLFQKSLFHEFFHMLQTEDSRKVNSDAMDEIAASLTEQKLWRSYLKKQGIVGNIPVSYPELAYPAQNICKELGINENDIIMSTTAFDNGRQKSIIKQFKNNDLNYFKDFIEPLDEIYQMDRYERWEECPLDKEEIENRKVTARTKLTKTQKASAMENVQ